MHRLLFVVISFLFCSPMYGADSSITFSELNKFTSITGSSTDCYGISVASSDDTYKYFGYSVAISGDLVVVGTPYDNSNTYSGSAYLFEKPASGWANATQTSKLIISDAMENDLY